MKKIILALITVSILLLSSCESEPASLTKEEIDKIAIPLIEESLTVYDKAMGLFLEIYDESVTENGINYYKVKNISSKADLWNLINSVYTLEAGDRIFTENIEGSETYKPKFIEKDGFLYKSQTVALVGSDCYPLKSVTLLEQSENTFTVLADFYYTFAKMHFVKTDSGWRLENSVQEGEKEYLDSVENKTESILKYIEKDVLIIDSFKTVDTADIITEDEAKKIFIPLFERSYNIYHNYVKNAPSFNMGLYSNPDFKIDKTDYYFVQFPELKTLSDVWDSIHGAYTKASAKRLFYYYLDKNNSEARYIEREGKLYYQASGHGNNVEYDMSSLKLAEFYEDTLVFTLDEYVMDDFENKKVFVLEKNALGWRMSNGFDENVTLSYSRYEDFAFEELKEAEILYSASKSQEIFPISIKTDRQTIMVNAPIFTGIKTNNAITYKNYFAFENSKFVITWLGKQKSSTSTQNYIRYILMDKNGKIINENFNRTSAVTDIKAISKYPDGLKIVQKGEPGAYEQYLATENGDILSEGFDEISFFYNGIAVVRKGNKLGFISDDGATLLEPSIEIDDLRYNDPDKARGFQVRYMTDDAFVVSIGGELAIITLDRK